MCLVDMSFRTPIPIVIALSFFLAACGQSNTDSGPALSEVQFDMLCENSTQYDYSQVCFGGDGLSLEENSPDTDQALCSLTLNRRDEGETLGSLVMGNGPSVQSVELTFASQKRGAMTVEMEFGGEITDISDLGDEAYTAPGQGQLRVRIGSIFFAISILPSVTEQFGCASQFDGAIAMAHIIVDNIIDQSSKQQEQL